MDEKPDVTLHDLAAKLGAFPEDAFHFVREGLSYAVNRTHGPESPAQLAVMRYLVKNRLDLNDLAELYASGTLSPAVSHAIEEAGGIEKLNRHVTGAEMCWGLREYAHRRWGRLAKTVLNQWNVQGTYDFGRLVFAMIDCDFMQKQPGDSIDDFAEVFDFTEALEQAYEISFEDVC